jgi:NitT/TauT family transport system substrate-binding protein
MFKVASLMGAAGLVQLAAPVQAQETKIALGMSGWTLRP